MPASLAPRASLVGGPALVGVAVGALSVLGAAVGLLAPAVTETAFALGALAFGFGLLGWAGTLLAGDGFEAMQRHAGVDSGWSKDGSRRAMARVGGFGAGVMVAAVLGGTLLGV